VEREGDTGRAQPGDADPQSSAPADGRRLVRMRRDAKLQGEALAGARALFETTVLSLAAIAAEVGVSPSSLHKYAARLGWTRHDKRAASLPSGRPAAGPAVRMRSDAKLAGDRLETARMLFETTSRSMQAIGAEVGVAQGTIHRYAVRLGWLRGKAAAAASPTGMICPGVGLCPARPITHRKLFDTMSERIARCQAEGPEGSAEERERGVRALGALTRMFERLAAMDRALAFEERGLNREGAAAGARAAAEEIAPYDVEGLRRELSRELDKLVGERGA
jgi:hypothetical protein